MVFSGEDRMAGAMPDFSHEKRLGGLVAGVDEVGRGPLAGPVTAAAAILDPKRLPRKLVRAIDDSKVVKQEVREEVAAALLRLRGNGVWFAVACASTAEIAEINILHASLLAMRRAVERIGIVPDHVIVDGNKVPKGLACPATALVDGDALSLSIAAASILAKVTRDRLMARLATRYPFYGWATNAGYGTPEHLRGLADRGPCIHHRMGFAPLRAWLGTQAVVESEETDLTL
jgi:ribonuclease HII